MEGGISKLMELDEEKMEQLTFSQRLVKHYARGVLLAVTQMTGAVESCGVNANWRVQNSRCFRLPRNIEI